MSRASADFSRYHDGERHWSNDERRQIEDYAAELMQHEHDGEPLLYCAEGAQFMSAFKAGLRRALPTCPTCGSDGHSNNECAYRPSAREIALEAALHQIATETYNRQYDTKLCATKIELRYAARWHNIARSAIEPLSCPACGSVDTLAYKRGHYACRSCKKGWKP